MDANLCGDFICQRRKELQMTQKELASQIHVTDKAISRWERGLGFPDIQLLEPLSNALDVSIGELLNGKFLEKDTIHEESIQSVVKLAKQEKETLQNKYIYFILIPLFVLGMLTSLFYFLSAEFSGLWILAVIVSFILVFINFIGIMKSKTKYSFLRILISLSLMAFVILEEYRLAALWVEQNDISALFDVVPTVAKGLGFLLCVNIFLNFLSYIFIKMKADNSYEQE